MGTAKQLLPWGDTTVLGQTIRQVQAAHVADIVVVCGHRSEEITAVAQAAGVRTRYNPDYATGEMLSSLQTAVRQLAPTVTAVLVVLADQPMIEAATLNRIITPFATGEAELIAPVWNGRRGNPVLIGRRYFAELLALLPGDAPRTLLQRHGANLHLVPAISDAILRDLDTPAAYHRWRP